jgi:hypothetical protein
MQYGFDTTVSGDTYSFPNAWLELTRSGDTFTAYDSPDGVNWTEVDSTTITMASTATVGLFVDSHNPTNLATATFENVTVASSGPSQPVADLTAADAPPTTAAGGQSAYTVGFTTSATGALSGNAGSTISLGLPAGTGLGSLGSTTVRAAGTQVGTCAQQGNATTLSCAISGGDSVGASTPVTVTLDGVTNPPAGSYTLNASTSSDTTVATSPAYSVTEAQSVSSPSVDLSSVVSAATGVTYTVGFTTSSTGALSGNAGSTISIGLPAGTGLGSLGSATVQAAGAQLGTCAQLGTTTTLSCAISPGDSVGPSTAVTMTLDGVTNPPAGSDTLNVSTSSDVPPATSQSYAIGPGIKSFTPTSGKVGTIVTIKGVNLAKALKVAFNGTVAVITSDTAKRIITKVPKGAATGRIFVTTTGGTATSAKVFTVK